MPEYNEQSIKILSQQEAEDKFDWLKIEELANKYSIPQECIQRGFDTSFTLNMPPDYYINKYILKEDVEEIKEFTEVYRELMHKECRK